jgi:acetyltransferase-like isoleucine patch superfamily enzyme
MPEFNKRDYILRLGKGVIMPFSSILKSPLIEINDNTRINGKINIRGEGSCFIGKYCAIGYDVRIITSNHDYRFANLQVSMYEKFNFKKKIEVVKGDVKIGNNVWVGDNVTILTGVTIGDGAIIGADSTVTKNVAPYSIVAGNPARTIKDRFDSDIVRVMNKVSWWNWSEKKIRENEKFFTLDLTKINSQEILKSII